jgi:hypothetical protein
MRKQILWGSLAAVAGAALLPLASKAADHLDSPAAVAEPTADITDVYAWMASDAAKLNLVLNINHNAGPAATFSTAVAYAVHVTSMSAYGAADKKTTPVTCKFYAASKIECWAGAEYVIGDIAAGAPLESASKKLKVFAGRRNDPFFFELVGFQETVKKVVAAAPSLTFDANACPALDAATSGLLVKQLQSSGSIASATESKPAKDTFAGSSVLSIAVQLDKTLVTEKGPILAVWASTHRAN